jgi:hypothetical protein
MEDTPQPDDDWLLSPSTAPAADAGAPAEPADGTDVVTGGRPEGRRTLLTGSALAAAGLVAGAVGTFAIGHHGSGVTTLRNASSTSQQGPASIPGFRQGLQDGTLPGGGGMDGEQRLEGTLTAVGSSSVTVKTTSGTSTYTVTASSQLVRNGESATLAELMTGDPVLLHVYPVNGKTVVERLFAGTMARGSFPGGPGAPGGFAPGGMGPPEQTQPSGVVNG